MYGFTEKEWGIGEIVYNKLGDKTVNEGSRIIIQSIYGKNGIKFAKSIGGIFTLRVPEIKFHLGNPYSSQSNLVKRDNLIKTKNIKESVIAFICWVLFSNEQRACKIRDWLRDGLLKNKPLIYYKELGQPSHTTALEWLIDNYNEIQNVKPEDKQLNLFN